ncbi:MAG: TlyA family RNA methyltransferase [Coriobacteriales bacterium]|nr:TlyA family RNA methyltransferase [Coriobacteriales bacterium]
MARQRLDELLVARGLASDVEQARRLCLAGGLLSGDTLLTKPGMSVQEGIPLSLKGARSYVSRGGEKLAGALEDFSLNPAGLRCVDVGASTGGFTDCLLRHGARQVTAVDVAYGQLAWGLRTDERVIVFERTNVRALDPQTLGAPFDLAVADLSFIGLAGLMPRLRSLIEPGGASPGTTGDPTEPGTAGDSTEPDTAGDPTEPGTTGDYPKGASPGTTGDPTEPGGSLLALVKPQFELPASSVGRGGVVRDAHAHIQALESVQAAACASGLTPRGLVASRLRGHKGNIEFFFWAQIGGIPATIDIEAQVRAAWTDGSKGEGG